MDTTKMARKPAWLSHKLDLADSSMVCTVH